MGVRFTVIAIGLALTLMSAARAAAQDDAALLRDAPFNRDRNVAVTERAKPNTSRSPFASARSS